MLTPMRLPDWRDTFCPILCFLGSIPNSGHGLVGDAFCVQVCLIMKASERTVLIVEDNADDATLISMAFRRCGFENPLVIVHGPAEAMSHLLGEGEFVDRAKFPFPHLILLDHALPKDGSRVIKWVRRDRCYDCLPIVVFSGSDDP